MKTDRKKFFFCFSLSVLSGVILSFAFPPFAGWQIAFFSLVPLLFSASENSWKNFPLGMTSGFFFYSITLSWLYRVAGPVYLLLALYLSVFWGVFLYLAFALPEKGRIFSAAFVWFMLEIIMSNLLTGFPWILLGFSQSGDPRILKIAGYFGVYGISFLIVLANLAIFYSFRKRYILSWLIAIAVFAAVICLPSFIQPDREQDAATLRVMVVQPNIDSSEARSPYANLEDIEEITVQNLNGMKPDVVIWPEGIFHDDIGADEDVLNGLKALTAKYGFSLIMGTFTRADEGLYNSAVLIEGDRIRVYNKTHLVPYGEFILGGRYRIIRETFERIAGYVPLTEPGRELTVFDVKGGRIAPLICFENIFPLIACNFIGEEADVFVTITNDSWYGRSAGPYQHFAHNVLRAAETGRYFVQSAMTGISGVVSPEGIIEDTLRKDGEELFIEGALFYDVPLMKGNTLYSTVRDMPLFIMALIFTGAVLCRRK